MYSETAGHKFDLIGEHLEPDTHSLSILMIRAADRAEDQTHLQSIRGTIVSRAGGRKRNQETQLFRKPL
jgi:hypothetical protein